MEPPGYSFDGDKEPPSVVLGLYVNDWNWSVCSLLSNVLGKWFIGHYSDNLPSELWRVITSQIAFSPASTITKMHIALQKHKYLIAFASAMTHLEMEHRISPPDEQRIINQFPQVNHIRIWRFLHDSIAPALFPSTLTSLIISLEFPVPRWFEEKRPERFEFFKSLPNLLHFELCPGRTRYQTKKSIRAWTSAAAVFCFVNSSLFTSLPRKLESLTLKFPRALLGYRELAPNSATLPPTLKILRLRCHLDWSYNGFNPSALFKLNLVELDLSRTVGSIGLLDGTLSKSLPRSLQVLAVFNKHDQLYFTREQLEQWPRLLRKLTISSAHKERSITLHEGCWRDAPPSLAHLSISGFDCPTTLPESLRILECSRFGSSVIFPDGIQEIYVATTWMTPYATDAALVRNLPRGLRVLCSRAQTIRFRAHVFAVLPATVQQWIREHHPKSLPKSYRK